MKFTRQSKSLHSISGDIPGWKLGDKIGENSRNVVYAAHEIDPPHRNGVIKVFCAENDAECLKSFTREKGIVESQPIPGDIAEYYCDGIVDGHPYFIMERLNDLPNSLSIDHFVQIALDLTDNVKLLSSQHIFHTDIKPSNIGMKNGKARLFDYDSATRLNERRMFHVRNGTGHYMAPEVREDGNVSLLSEIYSLGVTLRELCPKEGEYVFDKVLSRATSTTPGQRPQTIDEFRADILNAVPNFKRKVANESRMKKVWIRAVATTACIVAIGFVIIGFTIYDYKAGKESALHRQNAKISETIDINTGIILYRATEFDLAHKFLKRGIERPYYNANNYPHTNVEGIYEDCCRRSKDE